MARFDEWFDAFVSEKEIPFVVWEIKAHGFVHRIDSGVVFEQIKVAPFGRKNSNQKNSD